MAISGPPVAETVFAAKFKALLHEKLPNADPNLIHIIGATDWQQLVLIGQQPDVLESHNDALVKVLYVAVGLAGLSLVGALSMKRRRVHEGEEVTEVKNV